MILEGGSWNGFLQEEKSTPTFALLMTFGPQVGEQEAISGTENVTVDICNRGTIFWSSYYELDPPKDIARKLF